MSAIDNNHIGYVMNRILYFYFQHLSVEFKAEYVVICIFL